MIYKKNIKRRGKSGVSDIVANILILSITVTLFSTLFYWVGTLPTPTQSVSTNFVADVIPTVNNQYIKEITITDLGGSPLYNSGTIIYISYQKTPQYNQEYTLSQGLSYLTSYNNVWLPGMVWEINLVNKNIPYTNQVTINIVDTSKNTLVWSNTIPTLIVSLPPVIKAEGTLPGRVVVSSQFQVWAQVVDFNSPISGVYVTIKTLNINNQPMSFSNSLMEYISQTIKAPSSPENFTVLISAYNVNGQESVAYFTVSVVLQFTGQAQLQWGTISTDWKPYLLDALASYGAGYGPLYFTTGSQPGISTGGSNNITGISLTISGVDLLTNLNSGFVTSGVALDIYFLMTGIIINVGSAPAYFVNISISTSTYSFADYAYRNYASAYNYYQSDSFVAPYGRIYFATTIELFIQWDRDTCPPGPPDEYSWLISSITINYDVYNAAGAFVQAPAITESPYIWGAWLNGC
ncbi:MAG: type IV pilin [Thermoplasmata archaeon]